MAQLSGPATCTLRERLPSQFPSEYADTKLVATFSLLTPFLRHVISAKSGSTIIEKARLDTFGNCFYVLQCPLGLSSILSFHSGLTNYSENCSVLIFVRKLSLIQGTYALVLPQDSEIPFPDWSGLYHSIREHENS